MTRHSWRRATLLAALLLLAGCKVELFASLPEAEANDVVSILLQAGIGATKSSLKEGASAISVEEADFARAVALLKQHGLPRKQFQTIGDVFQQTGLVSSPTQERARFLWALGQELSSTISQIDGVLTARVQVVLPDNDMMRKEPGSSSASVFIRHTPLSQASKLVPQIKSLIAGSVEGLTYDRVSVVLVPVELQELPLAIPEAVTPARTGLLVAAVLLTGLGLIIFMLWGRIAAILRRTAVLPGNERPR